jgi:hypothetical protein
MRSNTRAGELTTGDRMAGFGIWLLLLACFVASASGLPGNPDAEVEYQTTRSLARGEGFAISDATPEGRGIIAQRFDVREGVDGRLYSWFGVGQALLAVPLYWVGAGFSQLFTGIEERHAATFAYGMPRSEYFPHLWVGLRNPLLGAAIGWLLFIIVRRFGVGRRAAVVTALVTCLGTFFWAQARDGLSDLQATFFAAAALALWSDIRRSFQTLRPPSPWKLALLGVALGAMVLTRVVTAPLALVFALGTLQVLVSGRRRLWSLPRQAGQAGPRRALLDLVWFATPAVLAAALLLWANQVRFGDPFETGYSDAVGSGTFFSYPPHWGLLGVTVAPGKGLLWLATPCLLALGGVRRLLRDPWLAALVLLATTAIFLPPIHTQTWHGAWTYGPRYVLRSGSSGSIDPADVSRSSCPSWPARSPRPLVWSSTSPRTTTSRSRRRARSGTSWRIRPNAGATTSASSRSSGTGASPRPGPTGGSSATASPAWESCSGPTRSSSSRPRSRSSPSTSATADSVTWPGSTSTSDWPAAPGRPWGCA